MKKNLRLRSMIAIAMLSSISFVLMLFNFPLPPFPAFLQVDFSEVPAIIAAITMGPVAGILVELLKNVLDWVFSGSPTGVPVGHMANFATGVLFILPVWWVYHRLSTAKGMTTGLILGTFSMAIGMSLLNYVLFLPLYVKFMNFPVMSGEELYQMIVLGILPFNLLKGIILAAIILLLFRSMHRWIEKQRAVFQG
ncbi:Riboflavin ECF transporter S component FmnP [Bhargavaea cecembensis DSE10]|uniref:Riboflavin transporter n=1 Tax=Bhargavaea cecembensis DSE10 TaxID=1235279 RepID=M7NFV4_9BACL|nr:ECF transporter S component [Bhargavaea cecembensis]EMR07433.1 Riboflavin ECF transporter S component FmnP [Bhargavaea cecembensis DSE10]